MKKYISTLLLLCLLLPSAGTYLWLTFHKIHLKKEVKHKLIAGIDKEELVLLQFSKAEVEKKLKWEHSKEFEYNGHMYDVVKTKTTKDSISYWCWWDYEETKLNQKLNEIFLGVLEADTEREEKQKRLSSFYRSLFFQNKSVWHSFISEIDIQKKINFYSTRHYKSISFPPPEMPPKVS